MSRIFSMGLRAVPLSDGVLGRLTVMCKRTKYHNTFRFPQINHMLVGLTRRSKPYLHGNDDGTAFKVEGVSEKQFPIMLRWERPKHIYRYEQHPEGSGDCSGLPEINPQAPRLEFEGSEEFEKAPETLKTALSLEYANRKDFIKYIERKVIESVQRHKHDFTSLEVTIAKKTVLIRSLQSLIEEFRQMTEEKWKWWKGTAGLRHVVTINVNQRRALLRRLRETDYKRYEWLLEKLDLVYKSRPFFWEHVERRKQFRRLTDLWCEELKQYRLDELRMKHRQKQPSYLREKAETLRWIMQEEEELGMPKSVSQNDIDECLRQAKELESQVQAEKDLPPKEYFLYAPEVVEDKHQYRPG